MRRSAVSMLVAALALVAGCSSSGPYGKAHAGDKLPPSVVSKANSVLYCDEQRLDVYRPDQADNRSPAVLYAHPGGWVNGDKSEGSYVDQLVPALTKRGFVVVTVNYRLGAPWPAQIQDVACAVRFLRANHVRYGIDPERIGAWGGSAGAQLVSLVGTMDRSAGFDVGPYLDQSSRLQAVVDMYGPVDVGAFVANGSAATQGIFRLTRGTDPESLRKASPISWATSNDPPFLILQGDRDPIVPPQQSVAFARRLSRDGVSARLVLVKGGTHGLADKGQYPSRNDLIGMTIDFFKRYLMPDA